MNKNQKALLSFTLAALVFSAGCAFFSDNPLLTFIDVLSILSLVLLVGGLVEFLIHGGYFDFMTYSFSSAKNLLTRHPEAQSQRYFDYAQKQKERRGTSEHFLLKLSGILLGLSILLTILYEVI